MRKDQRTNRERQPRPGVRRILDALKALKEERPGLVEKATFAAGELAKRRDDGGRIPE